MFVAAERGTPGRPDFNSTPNESITAGSSPRSSNLRVAAVAAALLVLALPGFASAQDANMSTTVASLGSMSLIKLDAVKVKPATDHSPALPSLALTDNGNGPQVRNVVLQLPDLDLGDVAIASRVGDQPLPAVVRGGQAAGAALASSMRGLTFTSTGSTPVSLSVGQMGTVGASGTPPPGSPALAAAAVSFTPSSRLFVAPRVLLPVGSPNAQSTVGTAIQAKLVDNFSLVSDVGMAGAANTAWAPVATARLVGQWPGAGIETSVLRGAITPRTETAKTAFVSARDREAAQAQVQPFRGLTLVALTSSSRPASEPNADETKLGSLKIAYDGFASGQLTTLRQEERTASRESEITSLEWRQRGLGRLAVRFVQQRASDSAPYGLDEESSRVEVDLPTLGPRPANRVDFHAALAAGSSSLTGPGVNSKFSGRIPLLIDDAALTGETELGITGGSAQVLRTLRVTTDVKVVPTARLQLSYAYRAGAQVPFGQVFEARILRRLNLGW